MIQTFRFFTMSCEDEHEEGSKCSGILVSPSKQMGVFDIRMFPSQALAEMEIDKVMKQPEMFRPINRPRVVEVELSEVI